MLQATLIRLPEEILQALKLEAVKQKKSLAELIREAIEAVYGERFSRYKKNASKNPFQKLSGICETGITDGAVHHDRDLYGSPS